MTKFLIGAALVIVFAGNSSAQEMLPERIALQTVRVINTVENQINRQRGHYVEGSELFQTPEFRKLAESFGLKLRMDASMDALVPGFVTTLQVADTGDAYVILITNIDTGVAYKSDQAGVIFVGKTVEGSFSGVPIG